MQSVHVVLAVDPGCVLGCAVSMQSLLVNASPDAKVSFHLITGGLAAHDVDRLTRTATSADRPVEVSVREFEPQRVQHLLRSKLVTHMTYARLFLDELLPESVSRCAYIDCDLVFERDVLELWRTDLQGRCAAAVPNGSPEETEAYRVRLGLRTAAYFNAGVMLIDVNRWREQNVGPRALAEAMRVGEDLILHDQDALNCVLQGDWVPVPLHWNVWAIHPSLTADDRAVLHYMGAPKPWQADYDRPFGDRFYEYLDQTPFRGTRPWNPLGLGAQFARLRRRVPYLPTVLRMARRLVAGGNGRGKAYAR